jgi:hypothetical protein
VKLLSYAQFKNQKAPIILNAELHIHKVATKTLSGRGADGKLVLAADDQELTGSMPPAS